MGPCLVPLFVKLHRAADAHRKIMLRSSLTEETQMRNKSLITAELQMQPLLTDEVMFLQSAARD